MFDVDNKSFVVLTKLVFLETKIWLGHEKTLLVGQQPNALLSQPNSFLS